MIRRVLMTVACLVALGVAVPAAADPTDPADTTPSTSPSTVPSASASNEPASESPVSTPAAPTQPSVEPSSPSVPSSPASANNSSPASPSSTSSASAGAGRAAPTGQSASADGPSILSAGGPLAVYVTVYCSGPTVGRPQILIDNPAPGIAYVYRLIAQSGTDPVDITGEVPVTPFGLRVYSVEVPGGTYTVEVTGTDDGTAVSAPFTLAEPCEDPPLISFRERDVPCGPGDKVTGLTGRIENPKDDEVYTWVADQVAVGQKRTTGPVAADGSFTLPALEPAMYTLWFYGDEGSAFESADFIIEPCPTPSPATPPPSSAASSSLPPSTASSSTAPPEPIGSVAGNNTGDAGGLAATGSGPGLLALLGAGIVALLAGFGVLRGRVRTGRRG